MKSTTSGLPENSTSPDPPQRFLHSYRKETKRSPSLHFISFHFIKSIFHVGAHEHTHACVYLARACLVQLPIPWSHARPQPHSRRAPLLCVFSTSFLYLHSSRFSKRGRKEPVARERENQPERQYARRWGVLLSRA